MKALLFAAALFLTQASFAQKILSVDEAATHVGDSVQFCDKAKAVRYAVQETGRPTFFYFGKGYPNQVLTVIIWQKDRKNFREPKVELAYGDTDLCIRGRVELVDGKAVIVVHSDEQIGIREEDN